jgi:hypothetical protein
MLQHLHHHWMDYLFLLLCLWAAYSVIGDDWNL